VTCPHCQASNPAGALFCCKCGIRLKEGHVPAVAVRSTKRTVGFALCAIGFSIAIEELVYFAMVPRGGDLIFGPGLSMLFLPFTILGLILSHWAQRDLSKLNQRRSRQFIAALLMGYSVVPIMFLSASVEMTNHRGGSQESSAVAQLRTINTAEVTYLSSNQGSYGGIPELITAGLLDNRFTGSVSGYTFTVTASGTSYTAQAIPTSTNAGRYGYFALPDAVVRWADATMRTANSKVCSPCFPTGQSGNGVQ
jgi:hypothetical protein